MIRTIRLHLISDAELIEIKSYQRAIQYVWFKTVYDYKRVECFQEKWI